MIISVDYSENDIQRINELINETEASSRSEVLREALRDYHKKILTQKSSIDRNKNKCYSAEQCQTKTYTNGKKMDQDGKERRRYEVIRD